jgi:hypothetical protein
MPFRVLEFCNRFEKLFPIKTSIYMIGAKLFWMGMMIPDFIKRDSFCITSVVVWSLSLSSSSAPQANLSVTDFSEEHTYIFKI